jgi:lipopolysaccharide export system protein LptA
MIRGPAWLGPLAGIAVTAALAAGLTAGAAAQGLGLLNSDSDEPIEIEADNGIEWRQRQKVYVATGNVRVRRGGVTVFADRMVAHYREVAGGDGTEIWLLEAEGNMQMVSASERAWADNGVYDVDQGVLALNGNVRLGSPQQEAFAFGDDGRYDVNRRILVLTGDDLRFDSPNTKLTARDSLEYHETKHVAVARGNAIAKQGDRRLAADLIAAYIRPKDQRGTAKQVSGIPGSGGDIHRLQAFGNVHVSTPREIARAQRGDYNVDTGIATLAGTVKITRGENQLNGELAEVNLNNGVSRLLSDPGRGGGRVHGLFSPQDMQDKGVPQLAPAETPQGTQPGTQPSN